MLNRQRLKQYVFHLAVLPFICASLTIITLSFFQQRHANETHQEALLDIAHSAIDTLATHQPGDEQALRELSQQLIMASEILSIAYIDQAKNITLLAGLPMATAQRNYIINTDVINTYINTWVADNRVYTLRALGTDSHTDADGKNQHKLLIIHDERGIVIANYQILLILAAIFVLSGLLTHFFANRLKKLLLNPSEVIQYGLHQLINGHYGFQISEPKAGVYRDLAKEINTLSNQQKSAHDNLQSSIEQSTAELRETLETVEIQNIEIDFARKNALKENKKKSEFLATTSHEIRTPINSIIGFTELFKKTELSDKQSHYLETIEGSAKNLLLNINDLIDYSRIEIGKLNLDYKPVFLQEILNDALQFTSHRLKESALSASTNIDSEVPQKLLGDPMRLKQVMANLLANLCEFANNGALDITISIDNDEENRASLRITFNVATRSLKVDRVEYAGMLLAGQEINDEHLLNKNQMGLLIAKGLTSRMHGDIGLSSNDNSATLWFTAILGRAAEPEQQSLACRSKHNTPPILVVDDNRANRRLSRELILGLNIAVDTAESGEKAIEMIKQQSYSLILMDIQMPGMDGFETTKAIRSSESSNNRVPIVALTAHAVEEEKTKLLLAGMDDFLSKPVSEHELAELLSRWLKSPPCEQVAMVQEDMAQEGMAHEETGAPKKSATTTDNLAEQNYSPVDIEKSILLAKNNPALARDMLEMLIESLREDLPLILTAFKEKRREELYELIHKLHGGCCYCGVPKLLAVSKITDQRLKKNIQEDIEKQMIDLQQEAERLIHWSNSIDLDVIFGVDS